MVIFPKGYFWDGGVGNGGKSDLFGNTSAAVDFYKFRWDPMNIKTHYSFIIKKN